jgi:CelD/BcsL family acetyltransferase involved in cellulose biosynthesis
MPRSLMDKSMANSTRRAHGPCCTWTLDPLLDPRWAQFLDASARASVFHTPGWLEALRRTYGYQPIAFTAGLPAGRLEGGLVFCYVKSWLTGARLVSLPFSDHCEPLAESASVFEQLLQAALVFAQERCRYVELRPVTEYEFEPAGGGSLENHKSYVLHKLDLRPSLEVLFRGFHKSCIQSKVRRAERERLTYEEGRSEAILGKFYYLHSLTRRRHRLPPQPLNWFRNLVAAMGETLVIHIASKDSRPVAAIVTLFFKNTLVYKWGASDARFHPLGGMPLLFWKAIQEGKRCGAEEFDLGRCDVTDVGLARFKEHLGAAGSRISYFRLKFRRSGGWLSISWLELARRLYSCVPTSLAETVGMRLYKHTG